jgi:hypothetical protein
MTKFVGLGALAVALSCGIADVDAMYGKMSGGIGYTTAQAGDAAARQKVADAQALAAKITALKLRALNNLPNGMTPDEFIYELLNWPDDVIDASHNAKISEALMTEIMEINALNSQVKRSKFQELESRLVRGCNLLSETKIIDQQITKKTVTEVLKEFVDIDISAAELLEALNRDIIEEERIDHRDPIEKFKRKIDVINGYIGRFDALNIKAQGIDLTIIAGTKRTSAHQTALNHYSNYGGNRADPLDVRLIEPTSKTETAIKNSIAAKRVMTASLYAYISFFVQQLRLLQNFNQLNDDTFVEVWTSLGKLAINVAGMSRGTTTPYDTFSATGLLQFAAKRDKNIQKRLFDALPIGAKQPSTPSGVTNPASDAEYLIPNPEIVDWSAER